HRCGQDDDDRAHPVLHGQVVQDRRGPRGRRRHGLDGAGAGAGDHHHLRRHHLRVGRPPHQHHRHARPRRLHGRGRALAARPRRRRRPLRLGRRRRAAVRDRLAPGRQVQGPAHRLHQQDGPHRRELRAGRPDDDRPPRREPGPHPAADRRGGGLPGHRRPHQHEGDRLQGRPRQGGPDRGHPGRDARGGQGRPRGAPQQGLGLQRRARRAHPRGAGDPEGRPCHRHPQGDARGRAHAGPLRLLLQEQGRPAAARRDHRLPPEPARGPADRRLRARARRGRGPPGHPCRVRRGAVLRARVQDHGRPLRRQAHLLPRLLGQARGGLAGAQRELRQDGAHRPHPDDARERPRGRPGGLLGRHRGRGRHQAGDHGRHARGARQADPPRDDDLPRAGHQGRDRAQDEVRPGEDVRRPRPPGRGGPDLPRADERGVRPDGDLRHGRAAPRGPRGPDDARVQGRRERRPPAGLLPRDDLRHRPEGGGPVRPPDGRLGPVRHRLHRHRARARRGLRLHLEDQGRLDPHRVHPLRREGRGGGAADGREGGLPDGRRPRDADRRQVPRHGLLGDRLQGRGLARAQGGGAARQARAARADLRGRGRRARGLPRRRHRRPVAPARPHRGPGAPRQRARGDRHRPAVGDVRVRDGPALEHPGPRELHDAVRPLRGRAAEHRREGHRGAHGRARPRV
ncbi:MAG: Translation elongation factor G, partial [uncultured Solirubrobacteraceae bacterium]